MERTFIAIKPDGVQRGIVGEVISRFERKGFKLVGMNVAIATAGHDTTSSSTAGWQRAMCRARPI